LLSLTTLLLLGKQQVYLGSRFTWQSAQHVQRGLHTLTSDDHVAGTQAVLYPATVLPEFIAYVADRFEELQLQQWSMTPHSTRPSTRVRVLPPIDVLLNEFASSRSYVPLHLMPDVVQHIGAFSSAPEKNRGNLDTLKRSPSFTP
jgi:hypothetical protein